MITRFELKNFRKLENLELDFNQKLTILTGRNAVGKTSVLEAIYLISTLKSERVNKLEYLIKYDAPFSKVKLVDDDITYEVVLSAKSRKCFINGKEIDKAKEFVGKFQSVYFSPDDTLLITGSPVVRRHFMDLEISMLNKKYLETLVNARFYLKQRNEAIKSEADSTLLNLLTSEFSKESIKISKSRIKFIELLNQKLKEIHPLISNGENIELVYIASYDLNKPCESITNNLSKDKIFKTTTKGFHRDDFKVYLNSKEAINYASMGQLKNIALSIKLALVEVYEEYLGKSPLLLLDDVFSELDKVRQANLISFVNKRNQTIMTTNYLDVIPNELVSNAKVIEFKE